MLLWSRITLQLVLRAAWKSSKEWVAASKNSFCRIDDLRRWPVQKIGNMIGEIRYICDIDMSSDRHYLFSCFFRCIRSCAFQEMLHVTVLYVVSNREGWKVSLGYVRVRGVKTNIEKVKTLMYEIIIFQLLVSVLFIYSCLSLVDIENERSNDANPSWCHHNLSSPS